MEIEQNNINQNSRIGDNINQKINPVTIATNFVNYYYTALDTNLNSLIDVNGKFIYKNNSELCIQGVLSKGTDQIYQKIVELHKRGCKHKINSLDVVTSGSRRLNILVTGQIQLDGFVYSFSEYFHLASGKKEGDWWIQSDIIRTL